MLDNFQYRFWNKVKFSDGCWEWDGHIGQNGYGRIKEKKKTYSFSNAHRVSYRLVFGEPGNLYVCHKCDNRKCVRPDHLFLGTTQDNTRDRVEKNRCAKEFKIYNCKLSNLDVENIKKLKSTGIKQSIIAKQYNVSKQLISSICLGITRNKK